MPPLPTNLRRDLERAVLAAREAAEKGALNALNVLAVDEDRSFDTMTPEQRSHRSALRARMKVLAPSDTAYKSTARVSRGFGPLVEEVAYEQWHRMLFARFLAENDLLIHPRHRVAVSLEECAELAASEGEPDEWMLAARFASEMLPGIFRRDDPAAQIRFAADDRTTLEAVLKALPSDLFRADDALGWVYQFWQTKAKDEVNKSERKVGGKDLAPVTQLFTEHYMVRFLLENSLGAWWAVRHPDSPLIREWEYLRWRELGEGTERIPAAGRFDGWPATASEVTVMDPCCGSGHFLVAAGEMLRKMRIEEEGLTPALAAEAVLRDNLFGLELDARCTQLAAFALAFDAWRHGLTPPPAGGANVLPNIACSGISVGGQLTEWTRLAGDDVNLRMTLERLYELFKDAPDFGSLINPNDMAMRDRMFLRDYGEVEPLVQAALAKGGNDPAAAVFGADAQGVARAGSLLARRFTLVLTNPPYRGAGDLNDRIKDFLGARFGDGQGNLATAFLLRCSDFAESGGSYAMVVIQEWLFLKTYAELRRRLLADQTLCHVARLGPHAFETITGERVNVALIVVTQAMAPAAQVVTGIDASACRRPAEKATFLREGTIATSDQAAQTKNPDSMILLSSAGGGERLGEHASCYQGLSTGDAPRLSLNFWEIASPGPPWRRLQMPPASTAEFAGREYIVNWGVIEGGFASAAIRGGAAWGKRGVAISQVSALPTTLYDSTLFADSTPVIVPHRETDLPAVWAFCRSGDFARAVRAINPKLSVNNGYIAKIAFDLRHWQSVAEELYPNGLPEPHSDDPAQWLFEGNIVGSRAPLQVAVARLLGYRWPDQRPDTLDALSDDDGIVCLPALQSDRDGAERVRAFLAIAYGDAWSPGSLDMLLVDRGYAGKSLEQWLRDGFFEQHCELFSHRNHRPFIWQVWDGRRDGFSALVNYHGLNHAKLQKLAYTYLGSWIERQRDEKGARPARLRRPSRSGHRTPAEACRDPGRRAALRHLRPLEEAPRTADRLEPGPRRRCAPEHPAIYDCRRPTLETEHQVGEGPRQESRWQRSPQRPALHRGGEARSAAEGWGGVSDQRAEIWQALGELETQAVGENGRWLDPAEPAIALLHDLANGLTDLPGEWNLTENILLAGSSIKRALDDLRALWHMLGLGYTAQAAAICADLWEHCMLAGCCCLSPEVAEIFMKDNPDDRSLGPAELSRRLAALIASGVPKEHRPSDEDVEAWDAGDYASYKWLCQLKHPSLRAIVHTSGTTISVTGTLGLSAHPDSRDDDRPVKAQILYVAVGAIIVSLMLMGVVAVGDHPSDEVEAWKADIERVKEQLRAHLPIEEGDLPFGIFDTKAGKRLVAAIQARSANHE